MTNGGLLFFTNKYQRNYNLNILNNVKIGNFNLFETKILNNKTIFYRIQLVSSMPMEIINSSNMNKYLEYDKKISKRKNKKFSLKLTAKDLINFKFIKSTGAHITSGLLLYENIDIDRKYIKKRNLLNHNIFKIILDYFNE